ncbi:MAG: PQQ-dependent sugar dehydrogenase [Candidatus Geothermincolia bacterium]
MRKTIVWLSCSVLCMAIALGAASCGTNKAVTNKNPTAPSAASSTSPSTPAATKNSTGLPLAVPPGFSISNFAGNLPGPRAFAFDSAGNLLVSCPGAGSVLALPDKDNNGVADGVTTVAGGLNYPHGLAFLPSDASKLYVAETDAVAIYDYDPASMQASNRRKIIDLSPGGVHITRTLMFAPAPNNDKLLIAVGSDCNVCVETDPQRAKILIANADGSGLRTFASGLRNSVFMTINPATSEIWATENGRDNLGDDLPPDEVNIIRDGNNYGWPYYYGKNILDTQFVTDPATAPPASGMTPSQVDLQAHSAPLGLAFVTSDKWPAAYKGGLIIAFHGSWNRSVPTGDKLVHVSLDGSGNPAGVEDFITGWQVSDTSRLGRPADVIMRADGKMYVSDDTSGAVYRIAPI